MKNPINDEKKSGMSKVLLVFAFDLYAWLQSQAFVNAFEKVIDKVGNNTNLCSIICKLLHLSTTKIFFISCPSKAHTTFVQILVYYCMHLC